MGKYDEHRYTRVSVRAYLVAIRWADKRKDESQAQTR